MALSGTIVEWSIASEMWTFVTFIVLLTNEAEVLPRTFSQRPFPLYHTASWQAIACRQYDAIVPCVAIVFH